MTHNVAFQVWCGSKLPSYQWYHANGVKQYYARDNNQVQVVKLVEPDVASMYQWHLLPLLC